MRINILAVAAAIPLLCACAHTRTNATQDASVSVDKAKEDAAALHVEGKESTSLDLNSGTAIADYPGDVPLYAGKAAMDMKSTGKNGRVVIIQTPDSMDKINSFYKSELGSNGWKLETTLNTDKMVMYKASKDNHDLVIQIGSDANGQSTINQTLADK